MKEGRGRGKENKTPTSLIEISELTHAACATKNSLTARYNIAKKMSVSGGLCRSKSTCAKDSYMYMYTSYWNNCTTFQKPASTHFVSLTTVQMACCTDGLLLW